MTSIAFSSLFLGLVLGVQTLGVIVEGPVAAVEYELDGRRIARAAATPWSTAVDFGDELAPHELVARALDVRGNEIARTRQWLNLPRPRAEIEIVMEKGESGRAVAARFSWQSLFGSRPLSVSASFDGRPLSVGDRRVSLPPHDATTPHLLTVEVEFVAGMRSRADVVLGGGSGEEAKSELTAIPVRVRDRRRLSDLGDLQDCFEAAGRPLRVVAMEDGPAQVVIVRDRGNREAREVLGGGPRFLHNEPGHVFGGIRLAGKDRVRFVWPVARRFSDPVLSSDLFPSTADLTMSSGSLHWILTRAYMPEDGGPVQRFADAAAVAGLEAFASSTRRAVVVMLGSAVDSSRFSPERVRSYFERLRVPLFVWSLVDPTSRPDLGRWGTVIDVSSARRLGRAVRLLRKNLEDQRILWVDGKHLPQAISLTRKGAMLLELIGSAG